MSSDSTLVARAMPCALPAVQSIKNSDLEADALVDDLKKMTLQNSTAKETVKKEKKAMRTLDDISPAGYVTMQSLRSSALARKTNTTSRFARDGANLFADLLLSEETGAAATPKEKTEGEKTEKNVSEEQSEESADSVDAEASQEPKGAIASEPKSDADDDDNKEEKEAAETADGVLLSRGPIRSTRTPMSFHPYGGTKTLQYGAAAQSTVNDPTSYSSGCYSNYDCSSNVTWWNNRDVINSNSSTPDTINSDHGYSSTTSPQGPYSNYYQHPSYPQQSQPSQQYYSPNVQYSATPTQSEAHYDKQPASPFLGELTTSDLNRLLATNNDTDNELPESLSDFILKYSRRYTSSPDEGYANSASSPESNCLSPAQTTCPLSNDSGCDSPLTAGNAPTTSPAQPRGGISGPSTPTSDSHCYQSKTGYVCGPNATERIAKAKLRALVRDDDMDQAWAWTSKCMSYFPGALSYQDPDRDTLLHIVTKLMDLAKIYTLVERMLKDESPSNHRMFDTANRMNETPLFLAVERRCPEVVEYLLEAGANPNTQTLRHERDAPLHYAAARGMTPIVNSLCNDRRIQINALNGMGLSPLLCAVKNHGAFEEDSRRYIDNRATIQMLLMFGADPFVADATNGRTVIHYAVDHLDVSIIEIFKKSLSESVMTELVNKPDLCMETPLNVLQTPVPVEDPKRTALCLELITCGANASGEITSYPTHQSF